MIRANDNTNPTQLLWHYTTGWHIPMILRDGKIKPENPTPLSLNDLPVTWFSRNQIWEPTASKVMFFRKLEPTILRKATAEACCGLIRIGVDPCVAPFRVKQLTKIARRSRRAVKDLARAGIRFGASPRDWRFTPCHVPSEHWKAIQMWNEPSNSWVPYRPGRLVALQHFGLITALN